MRGEALNILIGGEAGQGLVTVGQILAKSLVRSGYNIVITQSYQSRIRGGHNTYAIRTSDKNIAASEESVDILIALNADTVNLHKEELSPEGRIIVDEALGIDDEACINVPFSKLAKDRFTNIAALGIACSLLGLDEQVVAETMSDYFGAKHAESEEENRQALKKSFEWEAEPQVSNLKLKSISNPPKRLMLNGNEAIALAAMSAGVKFCSFYPMTPATSVVLNLAAQAERLGLIVEQAEDEISAINMVIGASFAGAPSMVSTSGGGFALMTEGVSLAAMTETPMVIVVAQRPGPATGLPTRTEQADLDFVLYAGHGEFPRAIFAPGTIEECFHLTRKAFDLAERYQGPIFLLTDQFLADSYRAVTPFDIEKLPPYKRNREPSSESSTYRRYALTDSGVSTRLLPGTGKHLVVADSDEHTEDGHLTEDLSIRRLMVEKRLKKLDGMYAEVVTPEAEGDENPELLLISWGSTKGAASEAAEVLRSDGKKIAAMHFSQVWPLIPEQFMPQIENAKEVACI
ncbi:MAG: 2-oxoacid:acceptor oxidoreductase subunit alpha, partial [Kiritimatiellaceae bacterium]|nr:2-oxoacid:acceptor oxidoreductase subunit alpha [Kiritimatiellaceae bacterium]